MSLFNSDLGRERIREILEKKHVHIHFIGILGAGMAPLAELLAFRGVIVSGTDRDIGRREVTLPKGAIISPISRDNPPDAVVYSLAVSDSDPEIVLARELFLPLISRAELLGAVMLYYPERIGISGTHGKSTVTAIFDLLLAQADIPHTTVSGAPLASGSPLRYSGDGVFLFEACEYRDSFLRMHPTVSVITNIELDHADYFRDGEHFYSSFEKWALLSEGAVLVGEGEYSSRLSSRLGRNVYVVGKTDECDFKYSSVEFSDTGMDFSVSFSHFSLGAFHISTLGEHNVRNAVFAVAYAHLSGISMDSVRLALSRFTGIGRRLELLGYISGRAIYYDYAHHPTEIRCTLLTLKKIYGHVSCIFRPHTYTRTAALFTDFAEALSLADSAVLLDIYPAREEPIEGITSSALAEKTGKSAIVCDRDNAVNYCLQNTDGAIVLMGAGEVDSVKRDFILRIQDENK